MKEVTLYRALDNNLYDTVEEAGNADKAYALKQISPYIDYASLRDNWSAIKELMEGGTPAVRKEGGQAIPMPALAKSVS